VGEYGGSDEDFLLSQVTDTYTPAALLRKPDLNNYDIKVLNQYLLLQEMCEEGFSGVSRVSLKEITLYLSYYPVADVYYFVDLMREIDRCYRNERSRNKSNS